jgi:hypothetical protein
MTAILHLREIPKVKKNMKDKTRKTKTEKEGKVEEQTF